MRQRARTLFSHRKIRLGLLGLAYTVLIILILIGWTQSQQNPQDNFSQTETRLGSVVDFTLTPSATLPPPSTPIPTFVPTETFVPVPSLAFGDPIEGLVYLFETNHGCSFPCWWGIRPGETKWAAAQVFLEPLVGEFSEVDAPGDLADGSTAYQAHVSVPTEMDSDGVLAVAIVEDWWGFVRSISITTSFANLGYEVDNIREAYGTPDEILVSARGRDPLALEDFGIFSIGLYYEDEGIMAAAFGTIEHGTQQDEFLSICSRGMIDEFSWLMLWDPENPLPIELMEAPNLFQSGEFDFVPIGEISDETVEEILGNLFNSANRYYCFEVRNPQNE